MVNPKKPTKYTSWLDKTYDEQEAEIATEVAKRKNKPGAGRPSGVRTKWRTPAEIAVEKAYKFSKREENAKAELLPSWPGPFFERKDFPSVRPAFWINCPYCGQLFVRAVTWVASRSDSADKNGKRNGPATFCSTSCGLAYRSKPVFRTCAYCAKTFRVWSNNRHKRTCCDDCRHSVMSEKHIVIKSGPLVQYAFEHGIMADYYAINCEFCGAGQSLHFTGDPVRGNRHWHVRIATIKGKYVARCKGCYRKSVPTPAQKLRLKEARELIAGLTKK